MYEPRLIPLVDHLMNCATILPRLNIYSTTAINLGSSVHLWVNFSGISPPFQSSISPCFTALFGICFICLTRSTGNVQYYFRLLSLSLSRSSWLLLSTLIFPLDSSFCMFVPWKRFVKSMGPSHRKLTKNNLGSFCLWPPCCATPSSRVRAREQYR